MKTYFELVKANAKNMFRDRMVLFWFLAFPALFILLSAHLLHRYQHLRFPPHRSGWGRWRS